MNVIKSKVAKIVGGCLAYVMVLILVSAGAKAEEATIVTDEASLIAAVANGGEITIESSIELTATLEINKDIVINMNNCELFNTDVTIVDELISISGANVTFNGSGGIRYMGTGNNIKLVGVEGKETNLIINGGSFGTSECWDSNIGDFAFPQALFGVECANGCQMPSIVLNGGGFSNSVSDYTNGGELITDNEEALTINGGTFYRNPQDIIADSSISFEKRYGGEWEVVAISTEYSDEFKTILNENGEVVINQYEPKPEEYTDIMFEALSEKYGYMEEGLSFKFYQESHDRVNSTVCASLLDPETNKVLESHIVKIVYNYDKDIKDEIDKMVAEFPEPEEGAMSYDFKISDMEMINYWMTCTPDNDNIGGLLNYSGELKEYIGYKNIGMDARYGENDCPLFTFVGGIVNFENNGIIYAAMDLGARGNHVFYVPDDTKNQKEDLVAAAQKRIDDYVGNGKAKVEYAGTVEEVLDSFQYDAEHEIEGIKGKDICIKITINEVPHYAVVIKGSKNMTTPSYKNVDMATNVVVDTDDSTVPLDTLIQVEKLTEGEVYDRIMAAIKVKDKSNNTYDIQLHSKSVNKYIKKLKNGKFQVELPISPELDGKALSVYYVDEEGNVQVHMVTIENGFAIFTTDHFSAYTLAEEHEHEYIDGKCECGMVKEEEVKDDVTVPEDENKDEVENEENQSGEIDSDVPQTSDESNIIAVLASVVLSGALLVMNRKYKRI